MASSYNVDEWIKKSDDEPGLVHIYVSSQVVVNKYELISKLRSFRSQVNVKIGVRLDEMEYGQARNLEEAKLLREVLLACLDSGVVRGFDFDLTTIYDEKLQRRAAYYEIMGVLFSKL